RLMVRFEQHGDLLSWALKDRDPSARPRLGRSAAYAQLEIAEILCRAAHVFGIVQATGACLGSVRELSVSRINNPLWRPRIGHVFRRASLGNLAPRASGNLPLSETLRFRQHAERLQLAVRRVGLVEPAADPRPDASDVRRPIWQPLDWAS